MPYAMYTLIPFSHNVLLTQVYLQVSEMLVRYCVFLTISRETLNAVYAYLCKNAVYACTLPFLFGHTLLGIKSRGGNYILEKSA